MSAFDRIQNYSARHSKATSEVFDLNTPDGAFLNRVHTEGYKMYDVLYTLPEIIEVELYDKLPESVSKYYDRDTDTDKMITFMLEGLTKDKLSDCPSEFLDLCNSKIVFTEMHNVITTQGNQLVNAIAGSGKTTTLIFKIMYDLVTGTAKKIVAAPNGQQVAVPDSIFVGTFLRSGAKELEERLAYWQRKLGYASTIGQIQFSTLDAEFKRCLNAMGIPTPIADEKVLSSMRKKVIDSCGITRDGNPLTNEDYQIINSVIVYYRGRLDDKKYQHPNAEEYGLTPSILDLVVKQYANMRQLEGVMDFEEIQELLYQYLYVTPNPAVQDFVANRFNFMYIDEFQDTSQMQYAILKFYARGHQKQNILGVCKDKVSYTGEETKGKFVIVGDPSQCIYSFKGSDKQIICENFDEDFMPTHTALSYNYRCPSNVLNPIVPSIQLNPEGAKQHINAFKEGGVFNAYTFSSMQSMIKKLQDDLMADLNEGMTAAVLCRTNFDGLIPAFVLESTKMFNFSISGKNMTLNSPLPRKLIGVTSLFTERSTPNVKSTLEMFVPRFDTWKIKQLITTLKNNNMSIWQVPEEDIDYSIPSLLPMIKNLKHICMIDGKTRDKEKELDALKFIYHWLIVNTYSGDNSYCASARAYIECLLYILDTNDFKSVYEFIEELEEIDDRLNGRIGKKNVNIEIATVHEFKGKERDSVYVWNDSEGVFPSSKCDLEIDDQVEEERRVHYIACTRARKKSSIYAMENKVGMFAMEMDANFTNPIPPQVSLRKSV